MNDIVNTLNTFEIPKINLNIKAYLERMFNRERIQLYTNGRFNVLALRHARVARLEVETAAERQGIDLSDVRTVELREKAFVFLTK